MITIKLFSRRVDENRYKSINWLLTEPAAELMATLTRWKALPTTFTGSVDIVVTAPKEQMISFLLGWQKGCPVKTVIISNLLDRLYRFDGHKTRWGLGCLWRWSKDLHAFFSTKHGRRHFDRFFTVAQWEDFFSKRRRYGWSRSELRDIHINHYGFSIITREEIDILSERLADKQCLEVGAGTGRLSHGLRVRGVNVRAIDDFSGEYRLDSEHPTYRKHSVQVEVADLNQIDISPYHVIICSWGHDDMLHQLLPRMATGQMLFLLGEPQGGNCLDDHTHAMLASAFSENKRFGECLNKHHLQFQGMHDVWQIFVKRTD